MLTVFGVPISISEIAVIASFIGACILGWGSLSWRLNAIIARNSDADRRIEMLEKQVEVKLVETRASLETRISAAEDRISKQDVATGRNEERLSFIQQQLTRVLDLLETRRYDTK